MILALDSSTAWSGVGLYDENEGVVVDERIWRTGTEHCRQLMPEIDGALRAHGVGRADLTGVAVALGPGTFNGLRVATTTAKLIAHGLGRPLVGVDTLELHAAVALGTGMLVRPLLDAARGELATALFRAGTRLERLEEDRIAAPSSLPAPTEPTLFVGELAPAWREALRQADGPVVLATPAQCVRRPGLLAELALDRLRRGEVDDAASLAPLYLRQPHITPPRARG
ncbi:MAG TPA: tRNA (adenosine(37)-N6)-threonylcarbamoyltransferase complex dimerization subunit type 1 TsaB [Chloroflexota bacterium]